MSTTSIIDKALSDVPKALACGIVDMDSGLLLDVKTIDSHPQSILDLVAAATKDLFEGDMVLQIEDGFRQARGVSGNERYFQEMLIASTNLWHYFGRLASNPAVVVTVVCRGDANIGLVLNKCREIRNNESI